MSDLALLYLETGKVDGAMKQARELFKRSHVLGAKHPDLLTLMTNLRSQASFDLLAVNAQLLSQSMLHVQWWD